MECRTGSVLTCICRTGASDKKTRRTAIRATRRDFVRALGASGRVAGTVMTRSAKLDVVGVGLNAIDTLIPVAHYPARGSKVEFRSAKVLPGGQVATAMIACRQWGLRARYIGKVGDDIAAELHRSEFARLGVEAHLFTAPGSPSQQAFILVDDSGERTVL